MPLAFIRSHHLKALKDCTPIYKMTQITQKDIFMDLSIENSWSSWVRLKRKYRSAIVTEKRRINEINFRILRGSLKDFFNYIDGPLLCLVKKILQKPA